jgi:hypothetical protein
MSTIKVNTIENRTGSTLTLGKSGTTIQMACGATQTGFGRTGTVNWCTTAKTSPLTVASGNGYFINTTAGTITVTLPSSPSAGDIVAFKDYANTWDTNAVTVGRGGSKINGACACAILNAESQSVTLIYVDGTKGWQDIHDSTSNVTGNPGFTVASGGTETTSGDFKIHTFTADGPLNITNVGTPAGGTNKVSYMVVAGGGSGGEGCGAGGGAGGFREAKVPSDPYTDSPLDAGTGLAVSVQDYTITVGGGGAGQPLCGPAQPGTTGENSVFSSITSAGGGGGGGGPNANPGVDGLSGGSGGGGNPKGSGGAGNTPPVSPAQGFPGGNGNQSPGGNAGGGGGGASAVGTAGTGGSSAGSGGAGVTTSITASPVQRAGGGGGAWSNGSSGCNGGAGGGGKGGYPGGNADAGTINTGGGGGAGGIGPVPSGAGGSGIVVVRYKFQ